MKKHLLLAAALMTGVVASAQFTASNAPAIGDGSTLFVLDSTATAFGSETGTSAVWDYSSTPGYNDGAGNPVGRTVSVLDATTTANAADYPNSTNTLKIQDVITIYYTDDATGRMSQGMMFNEPTLGDVIGRYSTDAEQLMTYPFAVGDNQSDIFSGNADAGQLITNVPVTGNVVSAVDGKGTLKLGGGQDFTDVVRYKIQDTMNANVTGFGMMQMVRTEYDYYKFGNSITGNLPLFIHVHIVFGQQGSTQPMTDVQVVLSAVANGIDAGITNNNLSETAVYPNPATSSINVKLPSNVNEANVSIKDALGRVVLSSELNSNFTTLPVSNLKKGLYFITLSNQSVKSTKRLIIK